MKTLLIPFLLIAAVATASAHCGTCEAGHDKAATKVECAKDKACDKSDKACDKSDKACDKADKACDKSDKACKKEAAPAAAAAPASACCPASKAKS